jgi:DNA polymerase (family 10)
MKLEFLKEPIVDIFKQLAKIEGIKGRFFPSRAFYSAANSIENSTDYEVEFGRVIVYNSVNRIVLGQSSSDIFIEYVNSGESSRLNSEKVYLLDDPNSSDLTNVSGIGEVRCIEIFEAGIKSAEMLYNLNLEVGDIIPGTNITYSQTIDTGLKFYILTGNERISRELAHEYLVNFKEFLISNNINDVELYPVGSYRRRKSTVGDIDIILVPKDGVEIKLNIFEIISNWFDSILVHGSTKIAGVKGKTQVDVRLIDRKYLGAHILHGTGSQEFNIKLRALAKSKGMKLNEYCITLDDGTEVYFSRELEIFQYLGIQYVSPWNR